VVVALGIKLPLLSPLIIPIKANVHDCPSNTNHAPSSQSSLYIWITFRETADNRHRRGISPAGSLPSALRDIYPLHFAVSLVLPSALTHSFFPYSNIIEKIEAKEPSDCVRTTNEGKNYRRFTSRV
jgi:hypothetical protein